MGSKYRNMKLSINYQTLAHDMYIWRKEQKLTQFEASELLGHGTVWQGVEAARHADYYSNKHCYGRELHIQVSTFLSIMNLIHWDSDLSVLTRYFEVT